MKMAKQQKQLLIEKINAKAWSSPVHEHIVNNCYKFFFKDISQQKEYFKEYSDKENLIYLDEKLYK